MGKLNPETHAFFFVKKNDAHHVLTWKEVDRYAETGWDILAWCVAANRSKARVALMQALKEEQDA